MENIIKGDFLITTNIAEMDFKLIHQYLSTEAYWCKDISFETVKKSIENSLSFGILYKNEQVGFARVITDYATIAYLGDVFVLPSFRGQGLSKWLMSVIMNHQELQGLRRWILLTGDAHGLYSQFGWKPIANPTLWMEAHNPDVYKKGV